MRDASGISLYQIDGGGASTGNRVVNNTVLVASNGRWAINIIDGATGTMVRNNVLYSAHSFRGAITVSADSLTGLVSNYNIVEGVFSVDDGNTAITLTQWRNVTGLDATSIVTTNPSTLFANRGGGRLPPRQRQHGHRRGHVERRARDGLRGNRPAERERPRHRARRVQRHQSAPATASTAASTATSAPSSAAAPSTTAGDVRSHSRWGRASALRQPSRCSTPTRLHDSQCSPLERCTRAASASRWGT